MALDRGSRAPRCRRLLLPRRSVARDHEDQRQSSESRRDRIRPRRPSGRDRVRRRRAEPRRGRQHGLRVRGSEPRQRRERSGPPPLLQRAPSVFQGAGLHHLRRDPAPERVGQAAATAAGGRRRDRARARGGPRPMTLTLDDALGLDLEATAAELASSLSRAVLKRLRRRGIVVAVSGGIDSACVSALSVRAVGAVRVLALFLPERDSSPESLVYARTLCERFGIEYIVKDIAPILAAAGCYEARDAAVREVFPGFE